MRTIKREVEENYIIELLVADEGEVIQISFRGRPVGTDDEEVDLTRMVLRRCNQLLCHGITVGVLLDSYLSPVRSIGDDDGRQMILDDIREVITDSNLNEGVHINPVNMSYKVHETMNDSLRARLMRTYS